MTSCQTQPITAAVNIKYKYTSDDTSGGIQCSLKFVGNGLGCPNEQTI